MRLFDADNHTTTEEGDRFFDKSVTSLYPLFQFYRDRGCSDYEIAKVMSVRWIKRKETLRREHLQGAKNEYIKKGY